MKVNTVVSGDQEVVDWITIRNQGNLTMPQGQNQVPLEVELNVPQNAQVGKYNGNIKINLAPLEQSEGDVSILLGGNVAVELEVVDEDIHDFWVKSIRFNPIVEGQQLDVAMTLKNLGNVPIKNVETRVSVEDYKTGKVVSSYSGDRISEVVYPHTIKKTQMNLPAPDLKEGDYWANVEVFKDGSSVYSNRLFLDVLPVDVNNVVRTAVNVTNGELRESAGEAMMDYEPSSVNLKTSVTVRAPYTDKLIALVIVLLVVLVGVALRMNANISGAKPRKKKRK